MRPSSFPRDPRFRTPGPAFVEDDIAHLRSYADVRRALANHADEFTEDSSFWVPPHQRVHVNHHFMWSTGRRLANGGEGRHQLLRGLVEHYFRSKEVQALEASIHSNAAALLRTVVERGTGTVDLARDFAYPLALRTIWLLMGFPLDRERWMSDHIETYIKGGFEDIGPEPEEVTDYLCEVIAHRQQHPQDHLLDQLIAARREGTITELELLGYLWSLSSAGELPTAATIVNGAGLLAEFGWLEEARARLADQSWFRPAVEEILRYGTPFPAVPVIAVKEVHLGEHLTIPALSQARLWISAANQDDAINGDTAGAAEARAFDVTRHPNRHMAFGLGMHHCLGAQLARLEALIALPAILRWLPGLELDTSRPFERYVGIVDGIDHAPFRFDQDGAEALLADRLLPAETECL